MPINLISLTIISFLMQKIPESLDISSEVGFESSGRSSFSAVESDQTASTDSIRENDM